MIFQTQEAARIWKDRYQHNGETLTENLQRVANTLGDTDSERQSFFEVMDNGFFFPAGRTMCNAGIGERLALSNCYALNSVQDSMLDIFETVKTGAITQQSGGGTGYDFSALRPKGSPTSNDGVASGPVSFIQVFNAATNTILQGE